MIRNAKNVPNHALLSADVCIIGTGPAGLSVALPLLRKTGARIILLEGGEYEESETQQSLYNLETTGLSIERDSRIRALGGTSLRWSGGWRAMDTIDFEKKSWVPYSGWPIAFSDLEPYYEIAVSLFAAPPKDAWNPKKYWSTHPKVSDMVETDKITMTLVQSLQQKDWHWGKKFKKELEDSKLVDVILAAHVTRLIQENNVVSHVEVKTTDGGMFSVSAGVVVLAAGGIENARLMLVSNIGNKYDQVGRYYMDHPKCTLGSVVLKEGAAWENVYWNIPKPYGHARAGMRFTDTFQRSQKLLNTYIRFEPLKRSESLLKKVIRRVFSRFFSQREFVIKNFMEQEPRPENRVRLGEKMDCFGNSLPVIDWHLSPLDVKTVVKLHETVKEEIEKLGIGVVMSQLVPADPELQLSVQDASHHMGTTRMGVDPKESVVDPNCKVHEIQNLFIAGSSVFPTGGYANPNATIVALGLRLSDHIRSLNAKRV